MTDTTNKKMMDDFGHLNGLARSIGVRPDCREIATAEEIFLVKEWGRMRTNAVREQAAWDAAIRAQEARE